MSIPRKIAYNVVASSLAKVASTATALVGIGLITRYLGQGGFGMYATALAFLSFFSALGDWGIYQTTTREISRPFANEKKILANAIGIRLFLSAGILMLAPFFVTLLPYPRELKIAIIIIAISYVFSSLYQVLIGVFQKYLHMDWVAGAELCGKIIQVGLIAFGAKQHWSFLMIASTVLVNMLVSFILVLWLSRKFIKFRPSFDFTFWKKFLRQSIPIGLSVAIIFIYFKADTILLSLLRSPQEVGIYSAAFKVIENVSFFPAMIVGLTMPILSYNVFKNSTKFRQVVNKNFKVFVILILPLIVGTLFLADEIINFIAGANFAPSANVLRIIIFSLGFIFFGQLFNSILIVAKLQKQMFWALSFCATFNIVSNLIFIPHFSYYATAVNSVLTELLVVLLTGYIIYKQLNFFPQLEGVLKALFASGGMALFLYFFRFLSFPWLLVLSPTIYFLSLILLGAISKEEIMELIQKQSSV
jgi:O-antigen/teichoic acid export membrane protein